MNINEICKETRALHLKTFFEVVYSFLKNITLIFKLHLLILVSRNRCGKPNRRIDGIYIYFCELQETIASQEIGSSDKSLARCWTIKDI